MTRILQCVLIMEALVIVLMFVHINVYNYGVRTKTVNAKEQIREAASAYIKSINQTNTVFAFENILTAKNYFTTLKYDFTTLSILANHVRVSESDLIRLDNDIQVRWRALWTLLSERTSKDNDVYLPYI